MEITFAQHPSNRRFKDISGETVNGILILGYAGKRGRKHFWWCRCHCGNTWQCDKGNLLTGNSKSCGCGKANFKHGFACNRTPEYIAWQSMKDRCYAKNRKHYHNYGGRGIRVCDRWLHDFEAFLADVGPRPSPAHTLDRYPDRDGDYTPGNVRWATRKEQTRNQRNTHLITFRGETLCLADWAVRVGMHPATLSNRLNRSGWSIELALTVPPQKR